jgi:hypothetical protein
MNIYVHNLKARSFSIWFVEEQPDFANNTKINAIIYNTTKKNKARLRQIIYLRDSVN